LIGYKYIDLFRSRIDPDARPVGDFKDICKIMNNPKKNITYFIHYIEEFWYSFGKYYPTIGGFGISVSKEELEMAENIINAMIVIIMPNKNDYRFYGLEAELWYHFCEKYQTWNNHSAISKLRNGSIPIKMLRNLETVTMDSY
jgi:hypothetical protein